MGFNVGIRNHTGCLSIIESNEWGVTDVIEDYEYVSVHRDHDLDMEVVVSIYDSHIGPALGGTRILDYASTSLAVEDALNLSKAMAYKTAVSGVPLGGGKAVINHDSDEITDKHLQRYGEIVEELGGYFLTGEDVNVGVEEVETIAEATDYISGGTDGLGDPSPVTAYGVYRSIEASVEYRMDRGIDDVSVLIQGIGKVGKHLMEYLADSGAEVKIADPSGDKVEEAVEEYGVETVNVDEVYGAECDVFAPCALGGVLNSATIPKLECSIVAGSANNQLENRGHAELLEEHGILYAPDYVVNAGGLITIYHELEGNTKDEAYEEAGEIPEKLLRIYERASESGCTPLSVAENFAEERMKDAGRTEDLEKESLRYVQGKTPGLQFD
ncbi:MAG: Glu/Leu/Phe/Val dehydrogenase dimerization domain-containing protein [Halobacteria archaeon]